MRAFLVLFLAISFFPARAVAGPPARPKAVPPAKPTSPVPEDKWVWMPGGTFTYGCEPRSDCEKTRRKRGVPAKVDGFWIMKGRTTVSEYEACVLAERCSEPDNSPFCTAWTRRALEPTKPVHCVDHAQAEQFCAWAGGRLPTGKEWEYAADSGHDMNWDNIDTSMAHEWVRGSGPNTVPGYEPTRGGIGDLEPLWPSDEGNAKSGNRSQYLGFRCVQPAPPAAKKESAAPPQN